MKPEWQQAAALAACCGTALDLARALGHDGIVEALRHRGG